MKRRIALAFVVVFACVLLGGAAGADAQFYFIGSGSIFQTNNSAGPGWQVNVGAGYQIIKYVAVQSTVGYANWYLEYDDETYRVDTIPVNAAAVFSYPHAFRHALSRHRADLDVAARRDARLDQLRRRLGQRRNQPAPRPGRDHTQRRLHGLRLRRLLAGVVDLRRQFRNQLRRLVSIMSFFTIDWKDGKVVMLDQTLLPAQVIYNVYTDWKDVADAITRLVIRGAPAIGIAASMGLALGAQTIDAADGKAFAAAFEPICDGMAAARPTAVNLFWAIDRARKLVNGNLDKPVAEIKQLLIEEGKFVLADDIERCKAMGRFGGEVLPANARVLTHCNAGALATGGYGTALGVVRAAHEMGKLKGVLADETRPFLQGARLTAWELHEDGIPVTLIPDNTAGALMKKGEIDCVVVGSDRIASNGDVANKIGTYMVSVLAKEHGIPFYVAAPLSTVDRSIASGDEIPIEERSSDEVTLIGGTRIAPDGVTARYVAFDVTPAANVTAIFTEKGVARAPYTESLAAMFDGAE